MSFNCLTRQILLRTDSDKEYEEIQDKCSNIFRVNVDRTWSSNISLPVAKIKNEHRRGFSTEAVDTPNSPEPRLARSSGIRRDWSFGHLAENKGKRVRFG